MPTSQATIKTDRPERYLIQLCKHAAAMGRTRGGHRPRNHATGVALAGGDVQVHAEYTENRGVITIAPWGKCTLEAAPDTLALHVEAADQAAVQQIQDIITRDLERFGRREQLTITWQSAQPSTVAPATSAPAQADRANRRTPILLAVLIVAAIAVHLGLGGAMLADSRWASVSIDVILLIVIVKILMVAVGRRLLHRDLHSLFRRHRSGPNK
jgi:hypothetical protein